MANLADTKQVASGGFNPIRSINNFMTSISDSFRQSRQFQRTYNELEALSARDLADLGINRSDITRIAYDSVYANDASEYRR